MSNSPLWRVHPDDPEYQKLAAAEAAYWAEPHPYGLESTEDMPEAQVDRAINRRFSGRPHVRWEETLPSYRAFRRGLVLGTSALSTERRILASNPALHATFVDISEGAIGRRDRTLGNEFPGRVATLTADLNFLELERGAFDLIVSCASLHHVTNLEYAASEINAALSRDGYFFLNDYVGENRFQFSPAKKALYEAIYNRDVARQPGRGTGVVWDEPSNLSPMCGARSQDMLPVLREQLDQVAVRDAGALLSCMLRAHPLHGKPRPRGLVARAYAALRWRVMQRLPERRRRPKIRRQFLDELLLAGDVLTEAGLITPSVVFAIYRKRA